MNVALVVHESRPQAVTVADRLRTEARRRGIQVGDAGAADAIIAVGGDGTVLRAAKQALERDLPLLGVNVGRKGFLADVEPSGLDTALDRLADGDYRISERMTIRAQIDRGAFDIGLNDVVIEKTNGQSLVSVEVDVDGEPFVNYHADGLVFATPTGSTAYNLSAGGPLVDPEVAALILTPVAPHSLFSKSLVLHPDVRIRCTVVADRPVAVTVDGRKLGVVRADGGVDIERGAGTIRFLDTSGRSFPARVKEKFHLDEDRRFVEG